ncbi:MAG TPA: phosphotransferase [Woeseiaceae bacterium]|nr:phosphotransferase [Woeseiaceae bacterium]
MTPASADASFRRYFRVRTRGASYIAVDAPPALEDSRPFIKVAACLAAMELNAPRVIAAEPALGFMLLTDLGNTTYLSKIRAEPGSIATLYDEAIMALGRLQTRGARYQDALPPFSAELLRAEMNLFANWLCGRELDIAFTPGETRAWHDLCDLLIENAQQQPQVFVHADFHSRNLMVTSRDNPGILDFQDAMAGPITYDLVSLLKDCYVRLPRDEVVQRARGFHARLGAATLQGLASDEFMRNFELMGVQRHLKAAGIFARLKNRDGKSGYMADVPRTLSYIVELGDRYEELRFLVGLLQTRVIPALGASDTESGDQAAM